MIYPSSMVDIRFSNRLKDKNFWFS